MMLLPLLFRIVWELTVSAVRQEKEFKAIQIGNEELKLLVCVENLKESTKKATKTNK